MLPPAALLRPCAPLLSTIFGASLAAAAGGIGVASTTTPAFLGHSHQHPGAQRRRPRPPRQAAFIQRRGFLEQAGGDWEETWRRRTTPWDTGAPAPPLLGLLQRTDGTAPLPREPGRSRALVGGCGSGYDCWTLARHGWRVTGLDLSPTAVARAEELLALERARQQQQGDGKGWAGSVEFVCGDFFALPEEEEGRFDLIFDYTFLCALPPALRPQWASKTKRLLTPGHGQLVCLLFPVQEVAKPPAALNSRDGPPFEVSGALYTELLEQGGDEALEQLELASGPCPDSIKPRRGREWLGRWRRRRPAATA